MRQFLTGAGHRTSSVGHAPWLTSPRKLPSYKLYGKMLCRVNAWLTYSSFIFDKLRVKIAKSIDKSIFATPGSISSFNVA
jgi:hypothetical protein